MDRLVITDVAPRDGLQTRSPVVATSRKLAFIEALVASGLRSLEVTSFVSPRAVPQMADAEAVLAGCARHDAVRFSALAPNRRGLARAMAAGAREIAVVLSATTEMNEANLGLTLDQAAEESAQVIAAARTGGLRTRAYVAVAFECPFSGLVDPSRVVRLSERFVELGADEIVIADTIGAAAPGEVAGLLHALSGSVPVQRLGMHFHDTRGLGIANAYAALEAGVRRFDTSAGGLGGCPFAPGAAGNLATEDLVAMAARSGFTTGVDLPALLDAILYAEDMLGEPLGGRCMPWLKRQVDGAASCAASRATRARMRPEARP